MSAPVFGLYGAPACAPGHKLAPGASLDLVTPLQVGGVTLFRRSLWLPIPALARTASALALDSNSTLAIRFAPAEIPLSTGNEDWFSRVETANSQTIRLDFVWPAPVKRVHVPANIANLGFELFRIDGEQVADDPSQSGTTGAILNPPWVGSPVLVKLAHPVFPRFKRARDQPVKHQKAQSRAAPSAAPSTPHAQQPVSEIEALLDLVEASEILPSVTLAGRPTSPRLKLVLESPGPETLLWQGLIPGEQGSAVTLPAQPVASEWAAALEQALKRLGAASGGEARLRLDVESDAPCAVSLLQVHLPLTARYDLQPQPSRLDFEGGARLTQTVDLGLAPGANPIGLVILGRLEGGNQPAPAGSEETPSDRQGVLLGPDQSLVLGQTLPSATPLTGMAVLWHPLSETLRGRVTILADGGGQPGKALLEQPFQLDTPDPGWVSLRWAGTDLQSQNLWITLRVEEGAGLWLTTGNAAPLPGWVESLAAGARHRVPLPRSPTLQWLSTSSEQDALTGLVFSLGNLPIPALLQDTSLQLVCPPSSLAGPGAGTLTVSSAIPARLVLETAEWSAQL